MSGIEGQLLAVILRRSALYQPVYCFKRLEFVNSMSEGT
jgi:hypothetical protein